MPWSTSTIMAFLKPVEVIGRLITDFIAVLLVIPKLQESSL